MSKEFVQYLKRSIESYESSKFKNNDKWILSHIKHYMTIIDKDNIPNDLKIRATILLLED